MSVSRVPWPGRAATGLGPCPAGLLLALGDYSHAQGQHADFYKYIHIYVCMYMYLYVCMYV